jgi:coenzyme F420-reducing hydrogenase delta subunit
MSQFEPKIIGFLCNWCSYAGADLAGVSRIQYPPNIRVIRVMCSGRVDPVIILDMFANGADGVIVTGCHPGDCHYIEGNLHEERKIKMLRKLIALTGFESERLRLEWVSAAEGQRFAQIVTDFTEQVRKLGPSPISDTSASKTILQNIQAAREAAADCRLRVLVGREIEITEKNNAYHERIPQEEFDVLLDDAVEAEYLRQKMRLLTEDKPFSVKQLASAMGKDPADVLNHIVTMRRRRMIELDHVEGTTPFYKALEVA